MPQSPARIERLDARAMTRRLDELAALLHDTVQDGASVNFILPFSMADARAFWQDKALPSLERDRRALFVIADGDRIVATVMLDMDLPPNQAHRAEVTKLLVHPGHRRRGHARALMQALEREAADRGRWLVTLDTRTGDTAEPLYRSLGYRAVGSLPFFCRATEVERYDATTYMYKLLPGAPVEDSQAATVADAAPGSRAQQSQ